LITFVHYTVSSAVQDMQPLKVEVLSIHHVKGAPFGQQDIEDVDMVQLPIRDEDKGRDGAAQVQQGMQLHGCRGLAESCSREKRQAKVDGSGVHCVDRVRQIQGQRLVRKQSSRHPDRCLSKLAVDAPVRPFGGFGQVAGCHIAPESK